MDFKPQPSRRTSLDGLLNRPQSSSGHRPSANASSPEASSPVGSRRHSVSETPHSSTQTQKTAMPASYYSYTASSASRHVGRAPERIAKKKGRNWKKIG